jgi:hypothetical protein
VDVLLLLGLEEDVSVLICEEVDTALLMVDGTVELIGEVQLPDASKAAIVSAEQSSSVGPPSSCARSCSIPLQLERIATTPSARLHSNLPTGPGAPGLMPPLVGVRTHETYRYPLSGPVVVWAEIVESLVGMM